jgi:hypothetical protein
MANVILESTWKNSRGEVDGWVFSVDGNTVSWDYSALFDAQTFERSSGSAIFELASFKEFFLDFQRNGEANVQSRDGGSVNMKRLTNGDVQIAVRVTTGDGITRTITPSQVALFTRIGLTLGHDTRLVRGD